jgi:hypothetical protein
MHHILARLKRKSVQLCKVMSTAEVIINVPNLANAKEFDPHYKPDEDQWLKLSKFSEMPYAEAALGAAINTTDLVQLTPDQAVDVRFICVVQGQYRMYQRVTPASIIKKKFIKVSGEFSLVQDEKIILFNDFPDAIHDTQSDNLYFTDFSRLKSFFSKIEELYREATDEEVKQFLSEVIIKPAPNFSSTDVSKPNRQRIALVRDKLNVFTSQQIEHLIQEFPNYIQDVKIEDGAFVISNDNDLKLAIYCMEERFYTTPISEEKRLANSVLKLGD